MSVAIAAPMAIPVGRPFSGVALRQTRRLDHAQQAFLDDRWRQSVKIGLKRIALVRLVEVDPALPLLFVKVLREDLSEEPIDVLVGREEDMTSMVKCKSILDDRTAEAAGSSMPISKDEVGVVEVKAGTEAGRAAAYDKVSCTRLGRRGPFASWPGLLGWDSAW